MNKVSYTTQRQIQELREQINKEKKNNKKGINKKQIGKFFYFIIVVFLAFILISIIINKSLGKDPNIFGYQIYVVETGSMDPTFPVGTVIIVKIVDHPEKLNKGTIVVFEDSSGNTITHRIIDVILDDKKKISYKTKGDNPNNSPDLNLLSPRSVKAEFVMKIPFTGNS